VVVAVATTRHLMLSTTSILPTRLTVTYDVTHAKYECLTIFRTAIFAYLHTTGIGGLRSAEHHECMFIEYWINMTEKGPKGGRKGGSTCICHKEEGNEQNLSDSRCPKRNISTNWKYWDVQFLN